LLKSSNGRRAVTPFRSLRDYEEFVYTLPQRFPAIVSCTLIVVRRGARMATTTDEISFLKGYRLVVKELAFTRPNLPVLIE